MSRWGSGLAIRQASQKCDCVIARPGGAAAFLCHQAVEKYLNGAWTQKRRARPPATNYLRELGKGLKIPRRLLAHLLFLNPDGVRRAHEGGHLLTQLGRQAPAGRLAPGAVQQGPSAAFSEVALEPLELPDAEVQCRGALLGADPARQGGLDQAGPRHFLAGHRECLHGVTFS